MIKIIANNDIIIAIVVDISDSIQIVNVINNINIYEINNYNSANISKAVNKVIINSII